MDNFSKEVNCIKILIKRLLFDNEVKRDYTDYLEEKCETSKDQYPKTEKDLKNICMHLNGINCNHHLLKLMAQENNIQRLRDMAEIKC